MLRSVTSSVTMTMWISLQFLVNKNKIMQEYLASVAERNFLADEVCIYILFNILGVYIGVITKTDMWTTTIADNM